MNQENVEEAMKTVSEELSHAEEQYKALQRQHLSQLSAALQEKEKQVADGKELFTQLKKDFKYNLKLLQERDAELEENDKLIATLQEQVSTHLSSISELSVRLKEANDKISVLEGDKETLVLTHRKQTERISYNCERKIAEEIEAHSLERQEWEAKRKALEQNLLVSIERNKQDKNDAERIFEEQLSAREKEYQAKLDELESIRLTLELQVTSLTTETDRLRDERTAKTVIAEDSESAQRKLENELKQVNWELQDYRAMSNRVIQDLQTQISASKDTQRSLTEKYERKLAQAETRIREIEERYSKTVDSNNESVSELNRTINKLKEEITLMNTDGERMRWRIDDLENERNKFIAEAAAEKQKLEQQLKKLMEDESSVALREELVHVKKLLEESNKDIAKRREDLQKYQEEIVELTDKMAEQERQMARKELDFQKRCNDIQREEYSKSESLLQRLNKANEESKAKIKKLEKEGKLHEQAIISLKKDRSEAYETLGFHGLTIRHQFTEEPSTNLLPPQDNSDIATLKQQNSNLKSVIAQMRREMERLGTQNSVPEIRNRLQSIPNRQDLYIQSLEEEIKSLKVQLRETARQAKYTETPQDVDSMLTGENDAVKQLVASLNKTVSDLRSEKVELTAATRKQQIELDRLNTQLKQVQKTPNSVQVELDQVRYELNAAQRQLSQEGSSLRQQVSNLESQLAACREEAAEYHRALLTSNAENTTLNTELSELKMLQARSSQGINYGAQELVIQHLQSENERLRLLIKKQSPSDPAASELDKALAKISQLNKEKAVLTELSNRLRSELLKAGVDIRKPAGPKPSSSTTGISTFQNNQITDMIQKKLDQVESMQYEKTKADIQQVVSKSPMKQPVRKAIYPVHNENKGRPSYKPQPVKQTVKQPVPSVIERSSSDSSSFRPKSKPSILQPHKTNQKNRYQAPRPTIKPKSNVVWMKRGESTTPHRPVGESAHTEEEEDVPVKETTSADPVTFLDSVDLGSSIQEVWKLLDDQPSMDSSSQPS